VYVSDSDGIKVSVDGGFHWTRSESLTQYITQDGRYEEGDCRSFCGGDPDTVQLLTDMTFVAPDKDDPATRFATGVAGVFYTLNGDRPSANGKDTETWHRLLDTTSLSCLPRSPGFDKIGVLGRTLYVACTGRSILSFTGIPTGRLAISPLTLKPGLDPTPVRPGAIVLPGGTPPPIRPEPREGGTTGQEQQRVQYAVLPDQISQRCGDTGDLPTFGLELFSYLPPSDRRYYTPSGSEDLLTKGIEAEAPWQIQALDSIGRRGSWADVKPARGSLHDGRASVAVQPVARVCDLLGKTGLDKIDLYLTVQIADTTWTVRDTVRKPEMPG
jgi:hypothetical protein